MPHREMYLEDIPLEDALARFWTALEHADALQPLPAAEVVLPENHQLSAVDLGAIVAAGHTCARVRRQPRVAIIPTGSELVQPGEPLPPGAIVDFNSVVLAGQVREWGGDPTRLPITPDDRALIRDRVVAALEEHDVVLVNA